MQQPAQFPRNQELEREILAQPPFAAGSLTFSRQLSAKHSHLLEYRFQSRDVLKSIIVKRQFPGPGAERATLCEYSNLKRLREVLNPALAETIPEPLLALPERGMLVTNKVRGEPLTVILKRHANLLTGPFRFRHLHESAQRVGAWLRTFQDSTRSEPIAYSRNRYLAELEARVEMLQNKGFTVDFIREILQRISLYSKTMDGKMVATAARHGDFIPQNILVEKERVSVVDFEGLSEREPVYEDLGMFLGYVLVLGGRMPYSSRALKAVREGFLASFLGGDTIDQDFLNIYTLKGAVRVLGDGASLAKTWNGVGNMWQLTRRLKQLTGSC
jgi:hypothetical protein